MDVTYQQLEAKLANLEEFSHTTVETVRQLEAKLEAVREWQQTHRKLIDYIGETYPIPAALEDK